MFAAKDRQSIAPATALFMSLSLMIGSTANAHAGAAANTAPVNVPGRYVTELPVVTSVPGVSGRYVTGEKPAATRGAATNSTDKFVSGEDAANQSAAIKSPTPATTTLDNQPPHQKQTHARSSQILAQIRDSLPDLKKLYAKPIRDDDVGAANTFYESRRGAPLWVGDQGLTSAGRVLTNELKDADNWGLSSKAFTIPRDLGSAPSLQDLANAEIILSLSVLKYVRHARGGRVRPKAHSRFFDLKTELVSPSEILGQIKSANEPDAYLRDQHPTHPQFAMLQQALEALRTKSTKPASQDTKPKQKKVQIPNGPTLRRGMKHAHVALLRQRLKVPATGETENKFDGAVQIALEEFQSSNGLSPDGVVGPRTRRTLNGKPKRKPASKKAREQKLVINMERWRWMPRKPGDFYIWNNVPEFRTRVFDNGQQIYSEKIIVGKTKNPTPAFSADMKLVVFRPSWGVPNGIKRTEILPYLKQPSGFFGWGGADTRILKRHNLRVTRNGRPVDASKVNWSKVDIRNYTFTQPPSSTNVLGRVKFRFPNGHDVYMHDTPERHLFKQSRRTFSHGCIRVRNPRRLAEVILQHDKGWSPKKVGRYWSGGGTVKLNETFPVHTAYHTAVADKNGKITTFADIYGYDGRLARALGSRPLRLRPDPVASSGNGNEPRPTRRVQKPKKKKKKNKEPESVADIFASAFSP